MSGLQLVLSKTDRIDEIEYNILVVFLYAQHYHVKF